MNKKNRGFVLPARVVTGCLPDYTIVRDSRTVRDLSFGKIQIGQGMNSVISTRSLLILLTTVSACGREGAATATPIDGPYLMTSGAQRTTFSLEAAEAEVVCRPRPALEEFELSATSLGPDRASALGLTLRGYQPEQRAYDIEYGLETATPRHEVEVRISGEYVYRFSHSFRENSDDVLRSRCSIVLERSEERNKTLFEGALSCVMLWADTTSADYETNVFNNYVDLIAKFECEY